MIFLRFIALVLGLIVAGTSSVWADEEPGNRVASPRLTTDQLSTWIDEQFASAWQESKIVPPNLVDDATFMRRTFLDLTGSIPSVSEARDFLEYAGERHRGVLIDRLLTESRRPEKYADRTAANWATLWRRMMVPGNSPEAQMAVGLEPWLKEQFAANVPYNELARKLITAKSDGQQMMVVNPQLGVRNGGPALFFQAVGGKPESAASSVSRVFLGVRIGCAECHDHPFAAWKTAGLGGMGALLCSIKTRPDRRFVISQHSVAKRRSRIYRRVSWRRGGEHCEWKIGARNTCRLDGRREQPAICGNGREPRLAAPDRQWDYRFC